MQVEGCEKLTEANIIIAYDVSSKNIKDKTKFHNELYGRKNDGALSRIPHKKLANCVIEISQRNLRDVRPIFKKHAINFVLRIAIPETNSERIQEITDSIKDPYEQALQYDSLGFSTFIIDKLDKVNKDALGKEEFLNKLLAITDTVEKWLKQHQDAPLSSGFTYMFKSLEVADGKSIEVIERDISRIKESLRHWAIGYQVLKDSKNDESIDEALQRYKSQKAKNQG
ncbi:MAG TPA: hypothetical protein VLH35_05615 [Candidatus Acidoferrales bacterium]|nr:hypothetical protein [Candidatus Acidoferrales bacterium]